MAIAAGTQTVALSNRAFCWRSVGTYLRVGCVYVWSKLGIRANELDIKCSFALLSILDSNTLFSADSHQNPN